MNLKELVQEVNSALDYNPDLSAYKDQVARVLNRHYLQISSQYPWLFRQKTSKLTLRADITGDATTNKLCVGDETTSFGASNVLRFIGDSNTLPTREMLGNTLVINDNDTFTTRASYGHGASEIEFTITSIFETLYKPSIDHYGVHGTEPRARYGGADSDEWPDGYQPKTKGSGTEEGTAGIVLDRPITDPSTDDGSSLTTKDYYTDWKIEFRQYYLPEDCIEVLGMMDRGLKTPVHTESTTGGTTSATTTVKTAPDKGRIIFLDSSKEEYLYLDRDNARDPVVGIEGMPIHHDAPMVPPKLVPLTPEEWVGAADISPLRVFDPHLKGGDTYEYCYTFVYAGVESPPSPVSKITLDTEKNNYAMYIMSQSVEGSFYRDGNAFGVDSGASTESDYKRARSGDLDAKFRFTGRIKRFYRRRAMGPGEEERNPLNPASRDQGYQRWIHIGDHFSDGYVIDIGRKQRSTPAIAFPTEGSNVPVLGWPEAGWMSKGYWTYHDGELSKLKVLDESGPRQTIKVYRPPSQDMDVEIRYLSRPKRLVADADTPEWPVQYHHILVYKALEDVCLQHGMTSQSQLYERKAEDLLDRMRQKYLARTNRKYVRRGFDRSVFAGERWGTPSKIG